MNQTIKIALIMLILCISWQGQMYAYDSTYFSTEEQVEEAIPEEAIRLRIKSNSNSAEDQQAKLAIRDRVHGAISAWTMEMSTKDEARALITDRLPMLEAIIAHELYEQGVHQPFRVSLQEVDFPTKQYGYRLYPAGAYEAVYIELGEASGDNWWCVLFPPLCFTEISEEEEEPVENRFFVVDVAKNVWNSLLSES
ncbi:stage II sporulation protein R [Paenalkalicoccus suaedae]|uniref:Stage II sporulation protein R n=1 Tax=Paenalkalicoccus suaedae TaxID=2592382 RepID=A0A859FIP5_9BACI|nr:stage II sporulation protein R [Paenalkalicoccus suaedae]QKS72768.1 stage II sporulation protein R [Paenalkalicoccus suaedae]